MRRRLVALGLLATVAGCGGKTTTPRLVPAPVLPPEGVVIDLSPGLPRIDGQDRSGALAVPRGYSIESAPESWLVRRGGSELAFASDGGPGPSAALPPRSLLGPAVVIEVRGACAKDPDLAVDADDILRFEAEHGPIDPDSIVLLATGYPDLVSELRESDAPFTSPSHSPGFSREAMRLLVVERGVRRVGTDAPRLSPASDAERSAEEMLFSSGGIAITNLVNLERLPARGATIVIAPLSLANASSTPVRVLAVVPRLRSGG